jgi:phosphoribosylcarboxyaminoimidazole (NCAIR) mutase
LAKARVAIIMGSKNDWDTMRPAEEALEKLF